MSRGFGSDNHATIHPLVLENILSTNKDHAPSYGTDEISESVRQIFRQHFGENARTYFVFNGTAANVLCLRALLKSHEAALCTDVAHLAVDECGAPEFHGGNKIISTPSRLGKLQISELEKCLTRLGDQHSVQPRLISITQPTELGTCYSLEELSALNRFAKKNRLLIHLDGARLANAAVHLKCDFKTLMHTLEPDAVSFGGTKNGLMGAEAVIFFDEDVARDFRYIQKQEMQLPSKMRFLTTQFRAYFANDLWRSIAHSSLSRALQLREAIAKTGALEVCYPVESNAVFVKLPKAWVQPLKDTCFFYIWDEREFIARLMLSHDSESDEIAKFCETLKDLQSRSHS